MWVVLVSIVAVLIPLSRIVPPLYTFRIRSRVFRWYAQLREIEDALARPDAAYAELVRELDALEARVERIAVPLSYADELYSLRGHIEMVRARLRQVTPADGSTMSRSATMPVSATAAATQHVSALTSAPTAAPTAASTAAPTAAPASDAASAPMPASAPAPAASS